MYFLVLYIFFSRECYQPEVFYFELEEEQINFFANGPVELINEDALQEGFCHLSPMKLKFCFDCTVQRVAFSIVYNTSVQDANYILECFWDSNNTVQCTSTSGYSDSASGIWDTANKTLLFKSIFNHSTHAGHKLRVYHTCNETFSFQQHFPLKPCLSEFSANATTNGTSIVVDCQHSSSNHSMSGMCIVLTGEYNVTCSLKTCTNIQRLPNGIRYVGNYTRGMTFSCSLDGALFEITNVSNISGPGITSDSGHTRISFKMIFISVFIFVRKMKI